MLRYFSSLHITSSACMADLPTIHLPRLYRYLHSRLMLSPCVPTVLLYCSTGISTCCPSDTYLYLSLGPDLPRADQLYPGILGYSAGRILTFLSLLIPAFSLLNNPPLFSVWLRFVNNASPVGLRILSSSTCVGLRYGYSMSYSGFSRHKACALPYLISVHITTLDCAADLPTALLLRLYRSFLSRLALTPCVPTFLLYCSAGI